MIKTIADQKGIAKSLDKLFLTQSAVSHQLRDIEERLGVKIFYRTRNQWVLTEEGRILYDTAEKVLTEIEKATSQINYMRAGHAGSIRISTECLTTYHWLPAFMVRVKILYPDLEIKIVMEATHKPLEKLLNNELDLAITTDPWDDKRIKYIELFSDEVMAVMSKDHPLSGRKFLMEEDFSDQTLIIHSEPLDTVTVYQHFLRKKKVQPKQIIAMPLTEGALEMTKAGMGIFTMPRWALKAFVSVPTLQLVRIGQKGLLRTNYAAIRHEDSGKKHIQDFIENLKEELRQ